MPCVLMPLTIEAQSVNASIGHTRKESVTLYRFNECASMQDKETAQAIGHCCGFNVCVHRGLRFVCVVRSSLLQVSVSTLSVDFPTNGSKRDLAQSLLRMRAFTLYASSHASL
jgi:hypothetical protein